MAIIQTLTTLIGERKVTMKTVCNSNEKSVVTGSCRSKKVHWIAQKSVMERNEYRLTENERDFFRQVLVGNGVSRSQMMALLG